MVNEIFLNSGKLVEICIYLAGNLINPSKTYYTSLYYHKYIHM